MSDDLKPCPFCGGEPEGNLPPMRRIVQCKGCGASVVGKKEWNTRTDMAEKDAEIERLRLGLDATSANLAEALASEKSKWVRPDVHASHICRVLRQVGYLVPYTVLMNAMQEGARAALNDD